MRLVTAHAELFEVTFQFWVVLVIVRYRLMPSLALPVLGYLVEDLYFIVSGFQIMLCALLNLDRYVAVVFEIFGQPDCRKVAPTELLDNNVAVKQDFANVNRVVATDLVVGHALVLAGVVVVKKVV